MLRGHSTKQRTRWRNRCQVLVTDDVRNYVIIHVSFGRTLVDTPPGMGWVIAYRESRLIVIPAKHDFHQP